MRRRSQRRRRREDQAPTGLAIIHVEDRRLFLFVLGLFVATVLGWTAIGGLSIRNWNRVGGNTVRIEKQERDDIARARRADARICARENLVRAEVHVAYQQKQPMPRPEAFATEPILMVLLEAARGDQADGLKRVRHNLPILECGPNLKGNPAYPLGEKKQARFVRLYTDGLLDPVPSAAAAASGIDE